MHLNGLKVVDGRLAASKDSLCSDVGSVLLYLY